MSSLQVWTFEQQRLIEAMGFTLFERTASASAMIAGDAFIAPLIIEKPMIEPSQMLLRALQRASGGRDIGFLLADLDSMPMDSARKRALWPQLRALRRRN